MRVTFLGTGSAMPTGERYQTGLVLEDERTLLVDCGCGVLQRLQTHGPGYEAIDSVLLTHHHIDHVSDLMALLKARWLADAPELTIAGPAGTRALVDGLFEVHEYMKGRFDLTVRELDPANAPFEIAGLDVDAMETIHSMDCLAYRFDDRFGFGGDSEAFAELADFFDETAVVALDCSFPDGVDVSNHATPTAIGEMLSEADAELGRLYLTHCYPHTDGRHDEMLENLTAEFDVDARVAHDGLSLTIDESG